MDAFQVLIAKAHDQVHKLVESWPEQDRPKRGLELLKTLEALSVLHQTLVNSRK